MKIQPTGQERAHNKLEKSLMLMSTLSKLLSQKRTKSIEKRIISHRTRLKKMRTSLTFLSTRAKDPITRHYAHIALKEIAIKSAGLLSD